MKSSRTVLVALAVVGLSCTAEGAAPSGPSSPIPAVDTPASGDRILFSRTDGDGPASFFVVNGAGSGDEEPFLPGVDFEARHLSPDGERLAIVGPNEHGLIVGGWVRVDGIAPHFFAGDDPTLNLACGVWGPEGRMACEGWDDDDPSRSGVYTVRSKNGGGLRRLTRQRDIPCDYSPDGRHLAFVRQTNDDPVGRLMVLDPTANTPRSMGVEVALSGIACDWSPDGRSILVAGSDGRLLTVTPEGETAPIEGEGLAGFAWGAVWSPDGSQILFSMSVDDPAEADVYTVAKDGTGLMRVTDTDSYEEAAGWLP